MGWFGLPLSVHVAYFVAFFSLSCADYEWGRRCRDRQSQSLMTACTSLPFGFLLYSLYVQVAKAVGDPVTLCGLCLLVYCMDLLAISQRSKVNPRRTDQVAWVC